nr:MAG TPA: hypothetical protein [Bacteriophage sp.]
MGTSHIICCDYLAVMHYMLLSQLARVRGLKYHHPAQCHCSALVATCECASIEILLLI